MSLAHLWRALVGCGVALGALTLAAPPSLARHGAEPTVAAETRLVQGQCLYEPDSGGSVQYMEVEVTGRGWPPGSTLQLSFDEHRVVEPSVISVDASGSFTYSNWYSSRQLPDGEHTATVTERRSDRAHAAEDGFAVDCFADVPTPSAPVTAPPDVDRVYVPELGFEPPIGAPGSVTVVRGSGWPELATVDLAWLTGGMPRAEVTTSGEGTFSLPVLIMPREEVGPRELSAVAAEQGVETSATYLVVPGTLQPGTFLLRR